MKLTSSGIILLVVCVTFVPCVSLVSCAGMPSSSQKSAPPVEQSVTPSTDQKTPASETQPATEKTPVSDLPKDQITPQNTETPTPAEMNTVEAVTSDLTVPPGEKLLYFYPEPDFQFKVPVAPAVSTAPAAVVPKTVPAAVTAPASVTPAKTVPAASAAAKPDAAAKSGAAAKPVDNVLPGIWESEAVAPTQSVDKAVPAISPSRNVTVAKGQTLEVWYPGSGWVYLGDVSAQNGLSYQTRKLAGTDTLFTFKALKPGNYLLEFSRFDVLEDSFLSDALAVTVTDTTDTRIEKVRAPDYRSATPGTATASSTGSPSVPVISAPSTIISEEPSLTTGNSAVSGNALTTQLSVADANALLDKAKASLATGDAASALKSLESFFSAAVDSLDEGLFLKGQAYEANGPSRDMRKALDAYKTLTTAYPESTRWNEADARIRYISQYYLKIR